MRPSFIICQVLDTYFKTYCCIFKIKKNFAIYFNGSRIEGQKKKKKKNELFLHWHLLHI